MTWEIKRIKRRAKAVTESEFNERLANLWEILVKTDGQFKRSQVPVKIEVRGRLSNPLLKGRGR